MYLNQFGQQFEEEGRDAPGRTVAKQPASLAGNHGVLSLISDTLQSSIVVQLATISDIGVLFVVFSLIILAGPSECETLLRLVPGVVPILIAPLIACKLARAKRRNLVLASVIARLAMTGVLIVFIGRSDCSSAIFMQIAFTVLALGLFHNTIEVTACNTTAGPVRATFLKGICLASTALSFLAWVLILEIAQVQISALQTLFICCAGYVLALFKGIFSRSVVSKHFDTKNSLQNRTKTNSTDSAPGIKKGSSRAPEHEFEPMAGPEIRSLLLFESLAYALLVLPAVMFVANGPFFHVARDFEFLALLVGWLVGALGTSVSVIRFSHRVTAVPTTLLLQLGIIAGNLGLILTTSSYLTPLLLFNLGLASASLIVSTQLQLSTSKTELTIQRMVSTVFTILALTALFVYLSGQPTATNTQPYMKLSSFYLIAAIIMLILSKRNCNSLVCAMMTLVSPPLIGEHEFTENEGKKVSASARKSSSTAIYTTSRLSIRTTIATGMRLKSLIVVYSDDWLWNLYFMRAVLRWFDIFVINESDSGKLPTKVLSTRSITIHSNVVQLHKMLSELELRPEDTELYKVSVSDTRRIMFAMRCLTISKISSPTAQALVPHAVP